MSVRVHNDVWIVGEIHHECWICRYLCTFATFGWSAVRVKKSTKPWYCHGNVGIYPVATFATLIYIRSCHCCIFYGNMKTGKFNGPGRLNHGFSGLPVDVSVRVWPLHRSRCSVVCHYYEINIRSSRKPRVVLLNSTKIVYRHFTVP
jgi:hypothetical protein